MGSPVALLFSEWAEYENYIESHVAKFETVSANNFAPSVGSHGFSRFSESAVEFIQSQGLDPDYYVGLDEAVDVPFNAKEQLEVIFPDNVARSPRDVSFVLGRLSGETLTRTRLVFPKELRAEVLAHLATEPLT